MKPDFDAIIKQVDANPYPRHSMFTDGDGNPVDFGDPEESDKGQTGQDQETQITEEKKKIGRGRPKKSESKPVKSDQLQGRATVYLSKRNASTLSLIKSLHMMETGENLSYDEIVGKLIEIGTKYYCPQAYEIVYKKK